MKVAVLTDSGANLSREVIIINKNLFVVPLIINVDGNSYRDQIEISSQDVYSKISTKEITTSLPNMEDLKDVLETIIDDKYTDILAINISSGLSGTYNAFRLIFEEYSHMINIEQYDSKTLGSAQGYLVEEALKLIKENKTMEQIKNSLDKQRYDESLALYTVNTLKYLKKGGRIGTVEGTIGDVLNLKPIITVDTNGVYISISKSFGIKRALIDMGKLLIEKFGDAKIDLTIHYGVDYERAKVLGERLSNQLNIRNLTISELTPVLGIHTGPDMFAFVGKLI